MKKNYTNKEKSAIIQNMTDEDIWLASALADDETSYDADLAFQRFKHRISPLSRRRRNRIMFWSIASAVAILLIIFSAFSYQLGTRQIKEKLTNVIVETPYGSTRQVLLPDGSTVWLNPGSTIIYPREFCTKTRNVYLKGEARFEVAKDHSKPFIVATSHLEVEALGTIFSVQDYIDSKTTSAILEEGVIRVDIKPKGDKSFILNPNEKFILNKKTKETGIDHVDAKSLSAWKDGYLIFEDASFSEIMSFLQRKYDVSISYDAKKYSDCSFNIKFNPDETIEDALHILSLLRDDLTYNISGETITIK